MSSNSSIWKEYEAELVRALSALPPAIVKLKVQIAYNRMHGIPNSPDLLRAARTGEAAGEWQTGTV